MLLAVDIGNSNVSIALFDDARLAGSWRLATRLDATADELGILLRQLIEPRGGPAPEIDAIVVGSVVPSLNQPFQAACETYLGRTALVVGPGVRTGVRIRYDNPRDVGADRIANALAAHRRHGGPAVVIDFGTATTYDAIDAEGHYLGGAIAPGLEVSLDALVTHTAKLPRVEPVAPAHAIGASTVAAIQSGLVWGTVAQVEGMVARFRAELGGTARVVATGGQAELVAGLTSVIEIVDPLLTLEGLRLIQLQNLDGR